MSVKLRLEDVSHTFRPGSWLFDGLNVTLRPDRVYAVTGPSGSGKSTLLGIMAGWIVPQRGEVVRENIRSIRWVFQNPHGVAHRSALDHVALPLIGQGLTRQQAEQRAVELLANFGLGDVAGTPFGQLSGGEAQRLMLARGIASKPDLLLVDEPTAQLDRAAAAEVNSALSQLAGQGVIVVIATHDDRTRAMCTDVIDLEHQEDHDLPAVAESGLVGIDIAPVANPARVFWREALRESWRNLVSGTAHATVWALVLAIVVGGLGGLDAIAVRHVLDGTVSYVNQGGATWVLQATGMVDGQACDALAATGRVVAAGALRKQPATFTTTALPRTGIPIYDVTPGLAGVLDVQTKPVAGLWVSSSVAGRLGTFAGGTLMTASGTVQVAGVYDYPDDGRNSELGYAALAPTIGDGGLFDECWFTVWPADETTLPLARVVVRQTQGLASQIQISQLNPSLAAQHAGLDDYQQRSTRMAGCAGLLAGLVIGASAVWVRRLQHASALHAGLPKVFLLLQTVTETLSWAMAGTILAAPLILFISVHGLADNQAIAIAGVKPLVTGVIGALIGAAAAISVIRERQLFTLFKNR